MRWQDTLRARWAALAPREQRGLTLAALVVLAAGLWGVLVSPALRTLKTASAQHAALSAELDRMQALQTRAQLLLAKPALAPQDALKALQSAAAAQGASAQLQVLGEQATVTLKQVSATDLAPWLAPQALGGMSPIEAHLQRDTASTTPVWSGTLVFRLPAGSATP